jgi:subfamily B ATP-binding cassette protein MsbA
MKLGFVTEGLNYAITALVIVGGAVLVIRGAGQTSIGVLVAFMGYQATLISMMSSLTNMAGQFMAAKSAFDQLFTILDMPTSPADKAGATLPNPLKGLLSLDHVTFSYEPGKDPVLRDVSITVEPGQTVALVGRSGSGKTTLLNLLMRFYDPDAGAVQLDGHDIRDLPLRAYRSLFGVVLQDPYLFNTSIAANLRYGRPDATDPELVDCLKRAAAWSFVESFPDRLHQRVGEGGGQISGGQRQRLAIARCMLMNRRFVLLDEATSALDPESEVEVQTALRELFKGRTSFIIAHRLSTIRHADRILVMDDGRLAEEGNYDDLLARGGIFQRLHRIATSGNLRTERLEEAGFV